MNPIKITTNLIKGINKKRVSVFHKETEAQISWIQKKIHKHLDDTTLKEITIDQITFVYEHRHSLFHTYKEIFVREIYRFSPANSTPLIIDCGANIGLSILYFKKIYPQAKIIGFEPDPHNFSLLQKNILLNNFQGDSVTLIQKALWIHNNGITFNAEGTEGSKIEEAPSNKALQVPTQDLNEFLAQYDTIDFLKLDIEGAENTVIPTCVEHLAKVKNMFLEYHGKTNEVHQLNLLLQIVEKSGFSVYMTTADDSIGKPFVQQHSNNNFDVQLNIFCFRAKAGKAD